MKKIAGFFIVAILLLSSGTLYAQLGFQVGYAHSGSKGNLELGNQGHFSGTFRNSGFQGGITYDFNVKNSNFSIQTALLYSYFGGNTNEKNKIIGNVYGTLVSNTQYQYLDLPVRVAYSLVVTNEFKFFFFAGPNISYGLSANMSEATLTGKLNGVTSVERKYTGYNIYDQYKNDMSRLNVQAGVGGGVHYKNFRIKAGYDFGFMDLYTGTKRKNSQGQVNRLKRGQFSVGVGYVF